MSEPKVDETKPSVPKPKKLVSRNVAFALGIICVVLVAGLVGALAYYVNDKNKTISSLNLKISQLNTNNTNLQNQIYSLNSTINELLNETTIPLSYSYTVGDHMAYNITSTTILFEQNTSGTLVGTPTVQTFTGTINMDVISFDGENYTINETLTIPFLNLNSGSLTFVVNKTGYVTSISNPAGMQELSSWFVWTFLKNETKVGETWQIPLSALTPSNSSIVSNGTVTEMFGDIQNITVPAGTYTVFNIDSSGTNLSTVVSLLPLLNESISGSFTISGQVSLEYGTCRLIDSSSQEDISYQKGGQSFTSIDLMHMELVQDTNH
jgi:hypothetical protein